MADRQVVVDNVLCFLISRFSKYGNKQLKSAILDFYTFDDIYLAKQHLLSAVEQWKADINLPHIAVRREGEQRNVKSLDDIITVITCLDENLKLDYLPKYVAESPDVMPSMRIYDSDLIPLTSAIDNLMGRMANIEASVSAILKCVNTVNDKLLSTAARSTVQIAPVANSLGTVRSAINTGESHTLIGVGSTETEMQSAGNSLQQNTGQTSSNSTSLARDWASAVEAVSTPLPVHNRFSALQNQMDSNDDDISGSGAENAENSFTVYSSRRAAKRRRQQSSQQEQLARPNHSQQPVVNQLNAGGAVQRPGRGLLTGKLKDVLPGQRFKAANSNNIRKAVFCVDNVHPSVEVDDLRLFVTSLSVQVLSCFTVKPRRRRQDHEAPDDRKAFRLCIAAADRGRLLDDSKWPEYVTISEWYRGKPAATAQTADETTVTTEHTAHGAMGESPSVNDNTVVYNAGADTANMEESGQLASVGHGD